MNTSRDAAEGLRFAARSDLIGYGAFDGEFRVRERLGALALWLPEPGEKATGDGVLFALDEALAETRRSGAPLTLPSVGFGRSQVNITIAWNPQDEIYVAISAPDESSAQFYRLLGQQRREAQLLQQQAAAAEQRLQRTQALYRDIVESNEDAVLRLGPDLVLSFVSGPAARLMGLDAALAQGRPVRQLLPLPARDNPWRPDMCANGPASFEQPVRRADGALGWLWWRVRWLGDDGGPAEFQAVGRDVTELRKLRAEIDRANEDAKFAALVAERLRIAHDLHDTFVHSLVAALANLSWLRREAEATPLADPLQEVERETRAGLKAAREALGAMRGELEFPDGPGPALAAAAAALAPAIAVSCDIDPACRALGPARAAAIVRVAREALRNIQRHSGASQAALALRREPDGWLLTIDDAGIGMDPATERAGHYGLVGMREQARFAGGALAIAASPLGGTRIALRIADSGDSALAGA